MTNQPGREVERVAEGLTNNTREFIMSPFYTAHSHGISRAWFHDTRWWAGRELARLGLVERRRIEPGFFASIPNELCLAVREHLRSLAKDR